MTNAITKAPSGAQDSDLYDGVNDTFTRTTSTGGTITLNKVGGEVDALIVYGGGVNYTKATISSALAAIGTTNKASLVLRPGTWTITDDLTITSNITLRVVPGALLTISTGKTLTISGSFEAGLYQAFNCVGTGAVLFVGLQEVHPEWFGAKGDGLTDDTAAINAAYVATPTGKTLSFNNIYLISSTFNVNKAIHLDFAGTHGTDFTHLPGSYLIKKSTMTTAALTLTANNISLDGGGVVGQTGNTGDNIVILGNNIRLRNVTSLKAGGTGFRIGSDAGGTNQNSWLLDSCWASLNVAHGFYIHDNTGGSPGDNAGLSINCMAQSNGADGMSINNAATNTIINFLGELNTVAGLRLNAHSMWNTVIGGDVGESNGTDFVDNSTYGNFIYGLDYTTYDFTSSLSISEKNKKSTFTPVLTFGGASTGITYTTHTGTYSRIGNRIYFELLVSLTNKGSATGAAQITGLPYTNLALYCPASIGDFGNMVGLTGAVAVGVGGTSTAIIFEQQGATGTSLLTDTSFSNTSNFYISGNYPIAMN